MDEYVDAIIQIKVPKWQIGEEVSIHFPDTMMKKGKCETLDESVIQEILNKRCMTAVANEYLVALHGKRPKGEWVLSNEHQAWTCTHCGGYFGEIDNKEIYFYCPNCGADMRGTK